MDSGNNGTWTMEKMVNNNDLTHTALFRALNLISETRQWLILFLYKLFKFVLFYFLFVLITIKLTEMKGISLMLPHEVRERYITFSFI